MFFGVSDQLSDRIERPAQQAIIRPADNKGFAIHIHFVGDPFADMQMISLELGRITGGIIGIIRDLGTVVVPILPSDPVQLPVDKAGTR